MPELAFQLLPFVDVGQRSHHSGGHAVGTADDQRTREHPQVSAVTAADAVLELDAGRTSLDVLLDCGEQALQVVFMNAAEPVVACIATASAGQSTSSIQRASRRLRP